MKFPKNYQDVEYYVSGRKRRIAGSTRATRHFLAIVHEENPTATIAQLKELLMDKTRYILCPEAVEVLDAHISAGYGNHIPEWSY